LAVVLPAGPELSLIFLHSWLLFVSARGLKWPARCLARARFSSRQILQPAGGQIAGEKPENPALAKNR
jgi:hypothetical protein